MENIEFRIAQSNDEKLLAFKLRYKMLTEELGDERWANHVDKTYIDEFDQKGRNLILNGYCENQMVSTITMVSRKDGEFLAESIYDWEAFSDKVNIPAERLLKTSVHFGRGGLLPEFRNKGIYQKSLEFLFELSKSNQMELGVGSVDSKNPLAIKAHEKAGFIQLPGIRHYKSFSGVLVYRIL